MYFPILKEKTASLFSALIFALFSAAFFYSCDAINEPVSEFFDTYNESARIGTITYPSGSNDSDGIFCVDSDSEKTFTFEISNPQNLRVNLEYQFSDYSVQALADSLYDSVKLKQSSDRNSGTIVFSKDFLFQLEYYNYSQKQISGTIIMDERYGKRTFDSSPITARANSAPPSVIGAMLQQTSATYDGEYILCFYLPKTYGTVHENDLFTLIINGKTYYTYNPATYTAGVTIADVYTDSGFTKSASKDNFYLTGEPMLYPLGSHSRYPRFGKISGAPSDAYQVVYYKTGVTATTDTTRFTVALKDNSGLTTSTTVSNTGIVHDPNFYVSASGSDDDGDGTLSNPYKTINTALSEMKSMFEMDSTRTEGTVWVMSDLQESVDFATYQFANISTIKSISIKGYGGQQTLRASSGRVMHIGYTKSDITIANLELTGGSAGYADSRGGAGLYVSSSGIDTSPTLNISNCAIKGNYSIAECGAILLDSEYAVNITDCEISYNTLQVQSGGTNGAAGIQSVQNGTKTYITITNSSIINNKTTPVDSTSLQFGFAMNGTGYTILNGVTVTGNELNTPGSSDFTSDPSQIAAIYDSTGIKLMGNNTITGNIMHLTGNARAYRNIVLATSSDTATVVQTPISIRGKVSGTVGVMLTAGTPMNDVTITSNYSTYNTASPSSVFVEDTIYAIGYNSAKTEAAIVVSGGTFNDNQSLAMTFTIDSTEFTVGTAKTFTVTPVVTLSGTDITSKALSSMTWNMTLLSGSTATGVTSNTNTLTVPASIVYEGTYTLHLSASYLGITEDADFTLTGTSD